MQPFCLVLFVQAPPALVQCFMLSVYRRRVSFEREQVHLELFQVLPVTRRAELRAMELLEFLHEFRVF